MKRLLINISICITMMAATVIIIWLIPGTYPHDLAALVNKKEMFTSKKSPRIVLMGGSSLLSLDSSIIEKELNHPVANMGLWGGLSTENYLKELTPLLEQGDIVVLTIEYAGAIDPEFMLYRKTNYESKKFFFLMSPKRNFTTYLNKGEYLSMSKIFIELCQIKTTSYIRNIFTLNLSGMFDNGFPNYSKEFNSYGDRARPFLIMRPLKDSKNFEKSHKKFMKGLKEGEKKSSFELWKVLSRKKDPIDEETLKSLDEAKLFNIKNHLYLNEFHDQIAKKNIKLLFYFSHFPEKEYKLNKKQISIYYNSMKKHMKFPIINTPEDFVFPRKYFADTIYHLTVDGEKVRTKKLIKLLRKYIQ